MEMMAMVVMTMSKMTMPKVTMAMPVVPVMAMASTVPAMAAMPTVTVTSGESLTRDGQGSSGQRQSSNRGRNDRLDLRHGRLLVGQSDGRSAMIHP
jgi:hypothetical protein